MVLNYISKSDLFYKLLKCSPKVSIPFNDNEVFELSRKGISNYSKNIKAYNKLWISVSQEIYCSKVSDDVSLDFVEDTNLDLTSCPDRPCTFPIIIKPIVNLVGMSKNVYKVHNIQEFSETLSFIKEGGNNLNDFFWQKYIDGEHLSIDFILIEGVIQWHYAFRAHKDLEKIGTFEYWEGVIDSKPNKYVTSWIHTHFPSYTGVINVETIDNIIIEAHLRMGDINHIDLLLLSEGKLSLIGPSIIELYSKSTWTLDSRALRKACPEIYIITLFEKREKITRALEEEQIYEICEDYGIKVIQKDSRYSSHPVGYERVFGMTTNDLENGLIGKNLLSEIILREKFKQGIMLYVWILVAATLLYILSNFVYNVLGELSY